METSVSPRCHFNCKKCRPHFRYACRSSWVHYRHCDVCNGEDPVQTQRSTKCSSPSDLTVEETFTVSASPRQMRCETNTRQSKRQCSILSKLCKHKLFLPVLVVLTLIAIGFVVRFAQRELEWERTGFPNYGIKLKESPAEKKTDTTCTQGNSDRVYCTPDMDHFLSLYDIFFCTSYCF